MTTQLEDRLREVLRDAPEPDWHALRAAIDARASGKRRVRMLRATVGGAAAAAAVVAIAVGAANSAIFTGQEVTPAKSNHPTASGTPSPTVPATTAFAPRVKLANGDYRMPMAFPDVAPKGAAAPAGLQPVSDSFEIVPHPSLASFACLTNPEAAQPRPWGSRSFAYTRSGAVEPFPGAQVNLAGWPTTTARTAMQRIEENSGPCAFDRLFRKVGWPRLAATEGNQFVVEDPRTPGGKRFLAIRRVGDVTVDAWTSGTDEAGALAESRRLVDESVDALLSSRVLDDPEPAVWSWPDGRREASPDRAAFILPAIAPSPEVVGTPSLTRDEPWGKSSMGTVPVFGAQVGDPRYPGQRAVAVREAVYVLSGPGLDANKQALPTTSVLWSSFPDGQKAFDEIVANRGTARWFSAPVREAWSGHDEATTFLADQADQFDPPFPKQIALRLEGDVLIAVVAQGRTQAEARTIATKLADEAARNLASFGRGPDGRPGNGK
ncbi:MAG: hypothetical protein ABIW49_10575 [Knoellia sp.]